MKPTLFFAAALAITLGAAEPPWNPAIVKPCDRACLTAMMDRYTAALLQHDRSALPLADDVRFTENTALLNVGEGILWRAKTEPTAFQYYVADPVAGQVAIGTLVKSARPSSAGRHPAKGRTQPFARNRTSDRSQRTGAAVA
jgi:hypothetical protein